MTEMPNHRRSFFPVCLNVSGKRCVVIGGGPVSLRKVKALLENGAEVEVVSPHLCPELSELSWINKIRTRQKEFEPGDIEEAFLVIAATDSRASNRDIAEEARRRRIPVNAVDDPETSDFIIPSYLNRGSLTIAVSTGGASPALSRKIRTALEDDFGAEYSQLTELVGEVRSELKRQGTIVDSEKWQQALDLDLLIEKLRSGQRDEAKSVLMKNLES